MPGRAAFQELGVCQWFCAPPWAGAWSSLSIGLISVTPGWTGRSLRSLRLGHAGIPGGMSPTGDIWHMFLRNIKTERPLLTLRAPFELLGIHFYIRISLPRVVLWTELVWCLVQCLPWHIESSRREEAVMEIRRTIVNVRHPFPPFRETHTYKTSQLFTLQKTSSFYKQGY